MNARKIKSWRFGTHQNKFESENAHGKIDTAEVFSLYEFLLPRIYTIIGYNLCPMLVINLTGTMNTVTSKPNTL